MAEITAKSTPPIPTSPQIRQEIESERQLSDILAKASAPAPVDAGEQAAGGAQVAPRAGESQEEAEAKATAQAKHQAQLEADAERAAKGIGLGAYQPTEGEVAAATERILDKAASELAKAEDIPQEAAKERLVKFGKEPDAPEFVPLSGESKSRLLDIAGKTRLFRDTLPKYQLIEGEGITPQIASREAITKLQGLTPGTEEYHNALVSLRLIPSATPYVDPKFYNKAMDVLKPYTDPETGQVDIEAALQDKKVAPAYIDMVLGAGKVASVRGVLSDRALFEQQHIRLADDKYVSLSEWDRVPEKYRAIGLRQGYDTMVSTMRTDQQAFEASHVKLPDNQYVPIDQWSALPEKYQSVGIRQGYDAMVASIKADQSRYDKLMSDLSKFAIYEPMIGPLREGEEWPDMLAGYNVAAALQSGMNPDDLKEIFPPETIKVAQEMNAEMERSVKTERLYQTGKQQWYNVRTGDVVSSEERTAIIQLRPAAQDEFVRQQPALILPADPKWQELKDKPKSNPERQAYLRQWQDKVIDTATFVSLATMPYTMGSIGAVGRLLLIPKVGSLAMRVTGAVLSPVTRAATSMAKLVNLWPIPVGASRIADEMNTTKLQEDWQTFNRLSKTTKDEWAGKAGYPANFDKLTDEQQAVVLLNYSPPPGVSRETWLGTVGEKIGELTTGAEKGANWLQQRVPAPVSAPVTFLGGLGVGVLEGLGYVASIPLVAGNLVASTPAGTAAAFGAQTVKGMAEFFTHVLPEAWRANPALAAGRIIGLFVLSPSALLKLSKSGLARFSPRYVPERAMATEFSTVRIRFDQVGEFLRLPEAARMRIAEKAISELLKGKKVVTIEGITARIEIKNVPYQQVVGNTLWNFSDRPLGPGSKVYTTPQAAIRFGITTAGGKLVKGTTLNEIRVPDKFQPKMEKLLRKGEAELESVFGKGTQYDPIPGWTGKGISSNVYTGPYPIRRFTILGAETAVTKLTPAKLAEIRFEAFKASMGDLVKGWSGRAEALRGMVRVDPRIKRIDTAIASLRSSKPELLARTGEIVTPRQAIPHPSGSGRIKPRVTAVVRNSKGEIMLVKDVTEQSFGLPGGQVDVKWKLGQLGFRKLPPTTKYPAGRRVLAPEGAAHGQVKSETGIGLDNTRYLDTYMGKMNEYALSGSRIYEANAKTDVFKLKKSEIQDALWWDGKSDITVYPATYDILAGLAKKYGLDMSKVRIDNSSSILNRARDTKIADRLEQGKPLSKMIDPSRLDRIELVHLRRQKFEISRGEVPELKDWITAEGEIRTLSEIIHGRRKATSIKAKEPLRNEIDDALLVALRKDKGKRASSARELLGQDKLQDAIRAYERILSGKERTKILEDLYKRKQAEAEKGLKQFYDDYGSDIYRPELFSRRYAHWLSRYAAAAVANRPLGAVRADERPATPAEMERLSVEAEVFDRPEITSVEPSPRPEPVRLEPTREPPPTTVTELREPPTTPDGDRVPPPETPPYEPPPPYTPPPEQPPYEPPPPERPPVIPRPEPERPPVPPTPVRPETPPREPPPRVPPRIPPPETPPPPTLIGLEAEIVGKKARLPEGSIAWKQGFLYRWIPYQDWVRGAAKPRALPRGVTPIGAIRIGKTPAETVQMIGDLGAPVPNVDVDLGVTDIFIRDQAQTITFGGSGLKTNIGEGVDSPTMGMTVDGSGSPAKGHAYAKQVKPRASVSRTADSKEIPERSTRELRGGKDRVEIAKQTKDMLEGDYEEPVVAEPVDIEPVKVIPKLQKTEDEYPDLLATGYGKETYFDEDPEWLGSLEPSILRTKKKPVNRVKISKRKPKRGDSSVTTVGGIRL